MDQQQYPHGQQPRYPQGQQPRYPQGQQQQYPQGQQPRNPQGQQQQYPQGQQPRNPQGQQQQYPKGQQPRTSQAPQHSQVPEMQVFWQDPMQENNPPVQPQQQQSYAEAPVRNQNPPETPVVPTPQPDGTAVQKRRSPLPVIIVILLLAVFIVLGIVLWKAIGSKQDPDNGITLSGDSAESSENSGNQADAQTTSKVAEEQNAASVSQTDNTLTVLGSKDTDIQKMFGFYKNQHPNSKYELEFVSIGSTGEDMHDFAADYLNSGSDCDLLMLENGLMQDYLDNDSYTVPITALGFSESDFSGCYDYTLDIGRDSSGTLRAVTWQATPGGYVYRADLAETYFGVKTPDEMQNYVKDWDTFAESANTLLSKSGGTVAMTATLGGMWQVWRYQNYDSWLDSSGKVQVDYSYQMFAEVAKEYYQKGYVTKTDQWYSYNDWNLSDGKAMGEFLCTWCLGDYGVLAGMEGDEAYGKCRITAGPSSWIWGGTWFAVAKNCNSADAAHDFLNFFVVEEQTMRSFAINCSEFVNNSSVMRAVCKDGIIRDSYLGGQDPFSVLCGQAEAASSTGNTKYDAALNDDYYNAVRAYAAGDYANYSEMEQAFGNTVQSKLGLSMN